MFSPEPSSPAAPWSALTWGALLVALSIATLLIHGYHPFAEDGGLYAAGIEYTLDPSLFPHFTGFVTEHLRFSLFAPTLAIVVRATHLSLAWVLLLLDLLAAFFTMLGARALLRRCVRNDRAQLAGLVLLAAGWTLPIAGTSLFLMDPYVTARAITMPLSLFAIAYALDPWPRTTGVGFLHHPLLRCAACLALAAVFHPLMAGYALLFVLAIRATTCEQSRLAWFVLTASLLLFCFVTNMLVPAETPQEQIAVITRYYWFLSQWHWYERLGLLGPVVMLALVLRARSTAPRPAVQTLGTAAILLGFLCTLCALLFAHESGSSHGIARLQLLRVFLLLYAVMLLLLGAAVYDACIRAAERTRGSFRISLQMVPVLAAFAMATGMFLAERATFPASPHVELPWQAAAKANPWVQAFLWVRANTPRDGLFALDAKYVNTDGEDAQTFRAIGLRSALPDYSKDGGEASIAPALAPAWQGGSEAQKGLSDLADTERDRRLHAFNVTWMVLHTSAKTLHPCPYSNETVKVCRLKP